MARDKNELREAASVSRRTVNRIGKVEIVCSECGAQVDIVETDDQNDPLVQDILKKKVKDRDKSTYECPNGHNEGLEIG